MRFEHEGMALWFDTPDAPAPKGVEAGEETTVTIGVKPTDASNKIEVLYRVNQGSVERVSAKWRRNDAAGKSYFSAVLPAFHAGDTVEYTAVCRCAGRQLPSLEEAFQSAASFKVFEARNDGNDGKIKAQNKMPNQPNTKNAAEKAGPALGQLQPRAAAAPARAFKITGSNAKDEKGRGGNDRTHKAVSAYASPKSQGARGSSAATRISATGNRGFSAQAESNPALALSDNEENGGAGISMPSENGNENGENYSTRTSLRMEADAGDNQSDEASTIDDDVAELDDAEMILASTYDIEAPENNFQVRGKLSGGDSEKFAEHRVVVSFRHKAIMKDDEDAKLIWVSAEEQAQVADDGSFILLLPEKGKLESALAIKVLAPDGEILRHEEISHAALQGGLRLEVEPKKRRKIKQRDGRERREPGKLRGQVLDLAGKRKAVNTRVDLYARGPNDKDFQPVFSARTDSQGYFFGDYPHGKFEEAYGVVAVAGQEKVPVRLKENGVFPHKVILGITMPEAKAADEDCSCKALVPRNPDSEDLVSASETYSVDIGSNGCVNFTAPNRTLEEFSFYTVVRSTDPEIKGFYQPEPGRLPDKLREKLAGLGKGEEAQKRREKLLRQYREDQKALFKTQQEKHPGRGLLNARNPVDWENEVPGFYQATTIAHGHLLHFKQTWKADGYSLGDLLYSLPLAPCQKKQIAIVDWQRREKNEREERQRAGDEMEAQLSRDRDINEITRAALSEEMEAGSSSRVGSVAGGIGGVFPGGIFGVSGGYSTSSSEAWQDSARSLAASSLQQLSDKTKQSASSLRSQRSTVVQTTGQKEDVEVTTEVIANHNHCHAMTVEYFEVLRHFCVEQRLAEVQECLFVPLLMSRFDFAKAQRWRDTLNRFLRKDKLKKAFPAINRILDNYRGSDLPKGRYSEEIIQFWTGDLRVSFEIFRPRDDEEGNFSPANWRPVMPFLDAKIKQLYEQFFNRTDPEEAKAFWEAVENGGGGIWGFFMADIYRYTSEEKVKRDQIFEKEIASRIAQGILESIKFAMIGKDGETELPLDPTLISEYVTAKPLHVRLQPVGSSPKVAREDIDFFEMRLKEKLPPFARIIVHSGALNYRTEHMSHALFKSSRIENLLANDSEVLINTPLDPEEERNPRAEDRQIAHELIEHLNEHLVFYHLCLFRNMHRQHLYMLLDGFEIGVFDGERRTRRSLASVIENRMIGIAGNSLIFPVAHGYHLDPTFEVEGNEAVDLFSHYAPTTPIPPMRISVPTPGVYAEAVMGKCNSCEVKDDSRFWKWEESPCGDEPTAIQAPSTESRRAEPPNLTPTPLAQPIINLQNAPPAPDPTGLAAALQLLGNANLFQNITGLDQTQKNALAGLTSSLETAKAFGQMGLQLEQQKSAQQSQSEQQQAAASGQSGAPSGSSPSGAAAQHSAVNGADASGGAPTASPSSGSLSSGAMASDSSANGQRSGSGGLNLSGSNDNASGTLQNMESTKSPFVQAVFNEPQQQIPQQLLNNQLQMVRQAVDSGVLTSEQGDIISNAVLTSGTEGLQSLNWPPTTEIIIRAFCTYLTQQRQHWENVKQEIVRIATEEFQVTWNGGTRSENDQAMHPRITAYWRQGAWEGAAVQVNIQAYWSAVFIAWVINQAGGGDRFSKVHDEANYRIQPQPPGNVAGGFRPVAHWRYLAPAIINRNMQSHINPFWAFEIDQVTPQRGDIVIRSRGVPAATFADHQGRETHADIIVEVNNNPGNIVVIGGNASGPNCLPQHGCTVNRRTYPLNANGFVDPEGAQGADRWFAIVRINTDMFNSPMCDTLQADSGQVEVL